MDFNGPRVRVSDPDRVERFLREDVFITVFLAIVLGWILVSLWSRVIENLGFEVMGLDEKSAWDSFLLSVSVTVIFIAFVWVIDTYGIVPGGLGALIDREEAQIPTNSIPSI